MPSQHVIIVGGSVTGLGAALALSADGHRVTILEKDATPLPASPLEAFENWDRRGSPQVRHSHAFLARLYGLIRDHAPDLLTLLRKHGATEVRFQDMTRERFADLEPEPGDEDIVLLACRRTTFEWVLRRYVLDTGRVEFLDGVEVTGLLADAPADGVPHVRGVALRAGDGTTSELDGDLVLDASGRRSKLGRWLVDVGAAEMREETSPCGIFYSSRFYRLLPGQEAPVVEGAIGGDLGYLKYGIFLGDSRIFSITLAASPDDAAMRSVLHNDAFTQAATAIPTLAQWLEAQRSEPISDVHGMGNLKNTRRFLVQDGRPLATGVYAVGDALIHTNPIVGRGCTLGWIGAFLLAETLRKHPDDAQAFAVELDSMLEREIVPWYAAQVQQDRDSIAVVQAQLRGEDPFEPKRPDGSVDPRAYMRSLLRDGLIPALREDPHVVRVFMRAFNLLEAPENLLGRADIMQRVLAVYARRHEREPLRLGPTRDEMAEILASAAT